MSLNKEERIFGWAEQLLKIKGRFVIIDPFKGNEQVLFSYYPHDVNDDSISIFAIFGGYDIPISEKQNSDLQEQNLEWILIRDVTKRHSHKKIKRDLFYYKKGEYRKLFYNRGVDWYESFRRVYIREMVHSTPTSWKDTLQSILSDWKNPNS